jgi:DNA polymerase III alpha subunit
MQVDPYGRVIINSEDAISLLMGGETLDGLFGGDAEISRYNDLCRENDKTNAMIPIGEAIEQTPEEYHREKQSVWFMPNSYHDIDVWSVLQQKCSTGEEIERLREEQIEFQARGLDPVLRLMMFLVDDFRERKILWGVGRGSSVASFALYLIGITRINPIRYGLSLNEFLKD